MERTGAPAPVDGGGTHGLHFGRTAQTSVGEMFVHTPSVVVLFVCTLALTIACASVTYPLIERPGMRLGAALLRRRVARSAPQVGATAT